MAEGTQQILNQAYTLVVTELRQLFGHLIKKAEEEIRTLHLLTKELGIPIPSSVPSSVGQSQIERAIWLPIAQECVITLLDILLEKARQEKEGPPPSWLRQATLSKIVDLDEFAQTVGLDRTDAVLALGCARDVFLKSDLFSQPAIVDMAGEKFTIRKQNGGLVVKRLSQAPSRE